MGKLRSNHILGFILVFGLLLRLWGIKAGLPFLAHDNEEISVIRALRMGSDGLNPNYFAYPTHYIYILFAMDIIYFTIGKLFGLFSSAHQFANSFFANQSAIYLIARCTTAFYGVLTILTAYFTGKKLYDAKTGLISAFFMSLLFIHVKDSHYATVDVPVTFYVSLSIMFAAYAMIEGKLIYSLLSGFIGGLAIATKYPAGVIVVPLLLANLFMPTQNSRRLKYLFLCYLCLLLGFFIGCPYALLDWPTFWPDVKYVIDEGGLVSRDVMSGRSGYEYYFLYALPKGLGIFIYMLSVVGVGYAILKHQRKDIFILSFPVIFLLLMGRSYFFYERYTLPAIPALVILGSLAFTRFIAPLISKNKLLYAGVLLLVIIEPLYKTIEQNYVFAATDTRISAKNWIESNIPAGKNIVIEPYGPPLNYSEKTILELLKESKQEDNNKGRYFQYLLDNPVNSPVYNIYNIPVSITKLEYKEFNEYVKAGYQYFIVTNPYEKEKGKIRITMKKEQFGDAQEISDKILRFYNDIKNNSVLLKGFEPKARWGNPGPSIQIYKLKSA